MLSDLYRGKSTVEHRERQEMNQGQKLCRAPDTALHGCHVKTETCPSVQAGETVMQIPGEQYCPPRKLAGVSQHLEVINSGIPILVSPSLASVSVRRYRQEPEDGAHGDSVCYRHNIILI